MSLLSRVTPMIKSTGGGLAFMGLSRPKGIAVLVAFVAVALIVRMRRDQDAGAEEPATQNPMYLRVWGPRWRFLSSPASLPLRPYAESRWNFFVSRALPLRGSSFSSEQPDPTAPGR